jgi:hypothetical protein
LRLLLQFLLHQLHWPGPHLQSQLLHLRLLQCLLLKWLQHLNQS